MRANFSICIPAFNRARHLPALLDSIFAQDYQNFNVVICEDASPERKQIAAIVREYAGRHPGQLIYFENARNLGYDANNRNLVEKATGDFCFFMGNDDLLCPGALGTAAGILRRYDNVGVVVRGYAWFDEVPEKINQAVRYFNEERQFAAGREAITVCFRRSGVISGYIVDRDSAQAAATSKFDGTLFYQLHLSASVLTSKCAVFTPEILVLCRNNEPPEFGNSSNERGTYRPGSYTPEALLTMVSGALSIIRDLKVTKGVNVVDEVTRDYANYFYPYIRSQLGLPFPEFMAFYRAYGRMGFSKYPMFHLYCLAAYALGEKYFDGLTRIVRGHLGRSPQFGRLGQSGMI